MSDFNSSNYNIMAKYLNTLVLQHSKTVQDLLYNL